MEIRVCWRKKGRPKMCVMRGKRRERRKRKGTHCGRGRGNTARQSVEAIMNKGG